VVAAGDYDYDRHGAGYARRRRTDPRIAAHVLSALGDARTVLNVGAGAGSYEPSDRYVAAVEPSAAMRAQRPRELAPAIDAVAERLPFDDDAFDAAMAMVTVHQWSDLARGLGEMRRVARGPVVVMTFDPSAFAGYWLAEYAPGMIDHERRRVPGLDVVASGLGGEVAVEHVPVPLDCVDGFLESFYGRPEALLDPDVRAGQSAWSFAPAGEEQRAVAALRRDLESGAWDERHGRLRELPEFDGSLRLVISRP
jgi:SAM-dependent methyltransferase